MSETKKRNLSRWRLVLGKYAKPKMPDCLSGEQERMDNALELLYSREYRGRGVRQDKKLGPGSLDPSQLNVPTWLNEISELFPKSTYEKITKHALDRYQLLEIIEDPETLKRLEPSTDLLAAMLQLKGHMRGSVLSAARQLIARVVEELKRKLSSEILNALSGKRSKHRNSLHKIARNFDAKETIRRNLKNWDRDRKQLVVENPRFFQRIKRHLPWEIILCVDQSGSMVNSVIHSAVMAGILAGLPTVRVRLVVFDTSIVDLSAHVTDPVEVLLSVQLGGGTLIGNAMKYCETLVSSPTKTIFVLVTDFCEGGDPKTMIASCRRMRGAGIRLIGLASLDEGANAFYDQNIAELMAAEGMEIAALTPIELAHWLAEVMQR